MATYVLSPTNLYKATWDMCIGFIYLFCYMLDPFVVAFHFEPFQNQTTNKWQRILTAFLLIDMILVPFTATLKEEVIIHDDENRESKREKTKKRVKKRLQFNQASKDGSNGLDDPVYERDVCVLFVKYLRGDFLFDSLANLPIFIYEALYGFPDLEQGDFSKAYLVFMGLKFFRLFHLDEVWQSFARVKEILAEIFYLHRYMFENLLSWTLAATKLLLCINANACGWILIKKIKDRNGSISIDFEEEHFFGQYAEAVYFMVTTISTVGYGSAHYHAFIDTDGHWAAEMAYMTFLTASGILLFSSVTNEIFSYKTLLSVDQLVAQSTADMENFLNELESRQKNRNLPPEIIDQCKEYIED